MGKGGILWLIISKFDGWALIGAWGAIRMNTVLYFNETAKLFTSQLTVQGCTLKTALTFHITAHNIK